jgi:hypothetical protein
MGLHKYVRSTNYYNAVSSDKMVLIGKTLKRKIPLLISTKLENINVLEGNTFQVRNPYEG